MKNKTIKSFVKRKYLLIFSVLFLITIGLIIIYFGNLGSTITGFFIFNQGNKNIKVNNTNISVIPEVLPSGNNPSLPIDNSLPDVSNNIIKNNSKNNIINASGASRGGRGGRGGRVDENIINIPAEKISYNNLSKGLFLYKNGTLITDLSNFSGQVNFDLFYNDIKISDFDLNLSENVDFSSMKAGGDFRKAKAFIHSGNTKLYNLKLYIPRISGQNQLRICSNASSYQQIHEGCIKDKEITSEYVLKNGDFGFSISNDGKYFIVTNLTGTGAESEWIFDNISSPTFESQIFSITLLSPKNNRGLKDNLSLFKYVVSGDNQIDFCKLIIDDKTRIVNFNITKNILQKFSLFNLSLGKYKVQINCTDVYGNESSSETRYFSRVKISRFSGRTTDLETIDITNVSNFILENPAFGIINFTKDLDLENIGDIDSNVVIDKNFISINSQNSPELNKSAILNLYNLKFVNPLILRDGIFCSECNILNSNENIIFSVLHFSNYSVSENSRLEIWDDSDKIKVNPGKVFFYANYSKVSDYSPILEASCSLTIGGISFSMDYNSTTQLYESNRSLNSGITYYQINCSAETFTGFNLTDYSSVQGTKEIGGANITLVKTETGPQLNASNLSVNAGNTTEINIFGYSTTKSWQGYFGNVSGAILLSDARNNILYNWSSGAYSGEVYATRAFDLNFPTIACANPSQISNEQSFIGVTSLDADCITSTFNKKAHPEFYVGAIYLQSNSCNSTNIFSSNAGADSFVEVLLSDAASNIVYGTILEKDKAGFDFRTHDFEMIVGENGHNGDNTGTPYYFYVSLR